MGHVCFQQKHLKKQDNSKNKIQEVSATLVHPKNCSTKKSDLSFDAFGPFHLSTKVRQLLDRWHEVHKMVVQLRLMVVGKLRLMVDDG